MGSKADDVLQRREPRFDRGLVCGLRVDAHEWLGAAGPEQHPTPVGEIELEAVVRANAFYLDTGHLAWFVGLERVQDSLAVSVIRLTVEVNVVARVCVGADTLLEAGKDLRQRLPEFHDHVREKQADEDAIALGNVAFDRESA